MRLITDSRTIHNIHTRCDSANDTLDSLKRFQHHNVEFEMSLSDMKLQHLCLNKRKVICIRRLAHINENGNT